MPDTTTGWYLYHKSKNYHAMQGGIREGFRMGARTGLWSFMALFLESTVDRCRGSSDMFSTMVATLTVAGGFSVWRKWEIFPSNSFCVFSLLPALHVVPLGRTRPRTAFFHFRQDHLTFWRKKKSSKANARADRRKQIASHYQRLQEPAG
jgi:hypothetical protein